MSAGVGIAKPSYWAEFAELGGGAWSGVLNVGGASPPIMLRSSVVAVVRDMAHGLTLNG